jgi:hypothetical protein
MELRLLPLLLGSIGAGPPLLTHIERLWLEYSETSDEIYKVDQLEFECRARHLASVQWLIDLRAALVGEACVDSQSSVPPYLLRALDVLATRLTNGERDEFMSDLDIIQTEFPQLRLSRKLLGRFLDECILVYSGACQDAAELSRLTARLRNLSDAIGRFERAGESLEFTYMPESSPHSV